MIIFHSLNQGNVYLFLDVVCGHVIVPDTFSDSYACTWLIGSWMCLWKECIFYLCGPLVYPDPPLRFIRGDIFVDLHCSSIQLLCVFSVIYRYIPTLYSLTPVCTHRTRTGAVLFRTLSSRYSFGSLMWTYDCDFVIAAMYRDP